MKSKTVLTEYPCRDIKKENWLNKKKTYLKYTSKKKYIIIINSKKPEKQMKTQNFQKKIKRNNSLLSFAMC
jgi:hypothetical protein